MANNDRPDLLVAIDLGMTCTGVAYAELSAGSQRAQVIQKWPGRAAAVESKVPSTIVYPSNSANILAAQPLAWGFLSEPYLEQHNHKPEMREWFKILLDDGELREHQKHFPDEWPRSMEEVEKYFEDYLRHVYSHVESKLAPNLSPKTWHNARIDFIFSLPTTWTEHTVVERFRAIARRAGYGSSINHTLEIGLTEAEAAAVSTSKEQPGIFTEGKVIVVCDIGGGTTDVGVLKVESLRGSALVLRQLDVVQGKTIGSVKIDTEFALLVSNRLRKASSTQVLALNEDEIIEIGYHAMKSSAFQDMKCEFGNQSTSDFRVFDVPAKSLPWNYVNRECGIWEQKIQIYRSDFENMFDIQIRKLCDLLDGQFLRLQQGMPGEAISHLILSGGLGNSEYVRLKLQQRYEHGGTTHFPNINSLMVRVAPEPQLAVCKGIIEDRVQKLMQNQSVMGWRCCRQSFGVGCKELYSEKNTEHKFRRKEIDPADGQMYVTDGIAWFVRVGQPVSSDHPIPYNFFRRISHGETNRLFSTNIFVCHASDATFLPNYINPDVKKVCVLQSNFEQFTLNNFEEKKKKCFSKGKRHFIVRYVIKAIIGPADLRFELWFKDQRVNLDNAIAVEWFPTKAPEPAVQQGDTGLGVFEPPRYI